MTHIHILKFVANETSKPLLTTWSWAKNECAHIEAANAIPSTVHHPPKNQQQKKQNLCQCKRQTQLRTISHQKQSKLPQVKNEHKRQLHKGRKQYETNKTKQCQRYPQPETQTSATLGKESGKMHKRKTFTQCGWQTV